MEGTPEEIEKAHDSMPGVCRNSCEIFRGHEPKDNVVGFYKNE